MKKMLSPLVILSIKKTVIASVISELISLSGLFLEPDRNIRRYFVSFLDAHTASSIWIPLLFY